MHGAEVKEEAELEDLDLGDALDEDDFRFAQENFSKPEEG